MSRYQASFCGFCITKIECCTLLLKRGNTGSHSGTAHHRGHHTPKPEAPGSNPGRDAKSNAESLDLSGLSAFLVSGGLSDQAVKSSDTDFSVSGFNALIQSKFPANKC